MDYSIITDKRFNTTGPCNETDHYMLPALGRLPEVTGLLRRREYFMIHAARQSGKTTALTFLTDDINNSEQMRALYCSLEAVQQIYDQNEAITSIADLILEAGMKAGFLAIEASDLIKFNETVPVVSQVKESLRLLTETSKKPIVVFFDEADCLPENVLISFLRQLRDGYVNRKNIPFPSSIALVGMRRIQDYKALIHSESQSLGSASPFNISAKSLTLRNFTLDEVKALYCQHMEATGQKFDDGVYDEVMKYSGGQPWLVNAIARECVEEIHNFNYDESVTVKDVFEAKETIIRRRDAHMLSLLNRLEEPQVLRIVEAVVTGNYIELAYDDPAFEYVIDLGILKLENGAIVPSNRMYAEMIARYLSWNVQNKFLYTVRDVPWVTPDGLDMSGLVREFQRFWQRDASAWKDGCKCSEAGPHILFMAFLQRITNGGGRITREMALGSYKLDIGIEFMNRVYAVEIKLKKYFRRQEALEQLEKYLKLLNAPEGWLLVFDSMPTEKTNDWEKRLTWEDVPVGDRVVHIVGF